MIRLIFSAIAIYMSTYTYAQNSGSKTSPFTTLEQALYVAQKGDTIHITHGTYIPIDLSFTINSGVVIIGGYDDQSYSNITKESTILSGDVLNNDIYDSETNQIVSNFEDNKPRIIEISSGDSPVTLKNIVVQGGYAHEQAITTGGGILINNGGLKIINSTLKGNSCSGNGGGAIHARADLTLENCSLIGNKGDGDGGAIFINGESVVKISNSTFKNNSSKSGSAVFLKNAISAHISNCTFDSNSSINYGTFTIYNSNLQPDRITSLINNTFANNIVRGEQSGGTLRGGSGIYVRIATDGVVNLVNNTLAGNQCDARNTDGSIATNLGGAIFARQGKITIANNVIAGNYSTAGYGDIFKTDGIINSLGNNLYTSADNSNIQENSSEIYLSNNTDSGFTAFTSNFDSQKEDDIIRVNINHNGGNTNTISIINPAISFNNKKINALPLTAIDEENLQIDLNGDGVLKGYLSTDQRGYIKNSSNNASIGSYEYDATSNTNILYTKKDAITAFNNSFIVNTENQYDYSIYDQYGKCIISSNNNNPKQIVHLTLNKGIYIIKTNSKSETLSCKMIAY